MCNTNVFNLSLSKLRKYLFTYMHTYSGTTTLPEDLVLEIFICQKLMDLIKTFGNPLKPRLTITDKSRSLFPRFLSNIHLATLSTLIRLEDLAT